MIRIIINLVLYLLISFFLSFLVINLLFNSPLLNNGITAFPDHKSVRVTTYSKPSISTISQKPRINEYYIEENFKYLTKHLIEPYSHIDLMFTDIDDCNAYADNDVVVMYTGCLKASHITTIVYILSHELGHQVLGHIAHDGEYYHESPYEEQDADGFGLLLYQLSGFTLNNFISHYRSDIIKVMGGVRALTDDNGSHGSFKYRLQRLQDQLKYLQSLRNMEN